MHRTLVDGDEEGGGEEEEEVVGWNWLLPYPCSTLNLFHNPLSPPVHSPPQMSPQWSLSDDPHRFDYLLRHNEYLFIQELVNEVSESLEEAMQEFMYLLDTEDSTKPSKAVKKQQRYMLERNAVKPAGTCSTRVLLECNRELTGGELVIDLRGEHYVYKKSDNHHFNCTNYVYERAVSGHTTLIENKPLSIDPMEVRHSAELLANALVTTEPDPEVEQVPGFGQTDPLSPEVFVIQNVTSLDLMETCKQSAIAKLDLQAQQSSLELNEMEGNNGCEGQGISTVIRDKRKISLSNTSASAISLEEDLRQHSSMSLQDVMENSGEGQTRLQLSICYDSPSDCIGTSSAIEATHDGDTIVKLDSERHKSMEKFEAIKRGGGNYEAGNLAVETINQKKRSVSNIKSVNTETLISLEDLQQRCNMTQGEAAESLGVSKSTLKRVCRHHGIPNWLHFKRTKQRESASETKSVNILSEQEGQTSLQLSVCHDSMTKPSDCSWTSSAVEATHGGDTIANLDSEQQKSMGEFDAFKGGHGTYEADNLAVETINQKKRSNTTSKSVITGTLISLEDLQQRCYMTQEMAAESLGVSKSTVKRTCRQYGISKWTHLKRSKKCEASSEPKSLNIITEQGNIAAGSSHISAIPNTVLHSMNPVLEVGSVTIKVEYGDTTIRFDLPYLSEMIELEEQVTKRFGVEVGSFKLEYVDEYGDRIWLTSSEDLRYCIRTLTLLGKTTIKMLVKPTTS